MRSLPAAGKKGGTNSMRVGGRDEYGVLIRPQQMGERVQVFIAQHETSACNIFNLALSSTSAAHRAIKINANHRKGAGKLLMSSFCHAFPFFRGPCNTPLQLFYVFFFPSNPSPPTCPTQNFAVNTIIHVLNGKTVPADTPGAVHMTAHQFGAELAGERGLLPQRHAREGAEPMLGLVDEQDLALALRKFVGGGACV